jgi:hypothetical protein
MTSAIVRFFQDLLQYYEEQMVVCRTKIAELDHSLRMDNDTPKSLNGNIPLPIGPLLMHHVLLFIVTVLQDIMQSHFKYLWSVAEKIKTQLDSILEEQYLFERQVCADAPRRFDEADKMLQRIDGQLLVLEDQLAHGMMPQGALQEEMKTTMGGNAIGGTAAAGAPATGGLFGAAPAAGGGGGGLFGGAAAAPAAGAYPELLSHSAKQIPFRTHRRWPVWWRCTSHSCCRWPILVGMGKRR